MTGIELDALEKQTRDDSQTLQPLASAILALATSHSPIVRWHVAQLLPRLALADEKQRKKRLAVLTRWLDRDPSTIVRVNALQSLFDLSPVEPEARRAFDRRLTACLDDERAAIRARARNLADTRPS